MKSKIIASLNGLCIYLYCHAVIAETKITKPSFVDSSSADKINSAGAEISAWLYVVMAVMIGLSALRPAFNFITGDRAKAVETSTDIIIGAVMAVVFGGIVFAVMGKLS